MTIVELRCNVGPRRLFGKVKADGGKPTVVDGNLVEFHCRDCTKALRSTSPTPVERVLHRFDVSGQLVETEVVEK